MVLPCRRRRAGLKHGGWPMKICKEEATVVWVPNDNFLILYFNYNLYKKIKINTIIFYINYELSLSSSIDLPEAIVPSLLIPIYRRQISSGRLVLFFHQPHPKTPTPSSAPWGSSTQARRRKAHGAPSRATRRLRLDLEGRHESHVAGVGAQFGEGRVVASDWSCLVSSSIWVAQRLDFLFPIFLFVCYNIAVSLLFWWRGTVWDQHFVFLMLCSEDLLA